MATLKKLIEIDKSLVTKLKIISAFENLSVKALMEKAIREYVDNKEIERLENLSTEDKEDLGLLLLLQLADKDDFVNEEDFLKVLSEGKSNIYDLPLRT